MRLFRHRNKRRDQRYPLEIPPYERENTESATHWWERVRSLIDALVWSGRMCRRQLTRGAAGATGC